MLPTRLRLNSDGITAVTFPAPEGLGGASACVLLFWNRAPQRGSSIRTLLEFLERRGIPRKNIISVFDLETATGLLDQCAENGIPLPAVFLFSGSPGHPDLLSLARHLWQRFPETILIAGFGDSLPGLKKGAMPPGSRLRLLDLPFDERALEAAAGGSALDMVAGPGQKTPAPGEGDEISWIQDLQAEYHRQKSALLTEFLAPSPAHQNRALLEIIEESGTGLILADAEGKILQVNRQVVEFLGMAPADCAGRAVSSLFREPDLGADFFGRVTAQGKTLSARVLPAMPLPQKQQFLLYAKPVHLPESRGGFLLMLRNRTFEMESRERLHELTEILNRTSEAVFLLDFERRITYWSPGAEKLYSLPAKNIVGKHVPGGLRFDAKAFSSAYWECVERGAWCGEMRQVTEDGRHIVVHGRWSLLRDLEGNPKSLLVINTDVTEKNLAKERDLRAQRLESIGTMVGGIAHDMNNILQPISISLQMLQEKNFDAETRSILDTVTGSMERACKMIRQILAFARGVEGQWEHFYVEDFLSDVEHFIRIAFPKNIRFDCAWPAVSKPLTGNPTQLYQALINLCVNARDAMPDGGELRIAVENVPLEQLPRKPPEGTGATEFVHIRISDTGPGIPPELREKILEPFFTTKPRGQGTGLGLSTTLEIIRNHGGLLEIDAECKRGATFHLYLPISLSPGRHPPKEHARPAPPSPEPPEQGTKTAQGGMQPPSAAAATPKSAAPRGNGETILLVDDEPAVLTVFKIALEKSGYRILAAKNSHEALEIYRQNHQDIRLMITDIAMPEMSGLELIQAIREFPAPEAPGLPIVATTGMTTPAQVEAIRSLGIEKILSKPCGSRMLLDTIKTLLPDP